MSNADIAREGFAAIARGDFDAVTSFLDPDVKWHGGNPADGCQNRRQALAWMRGRPRRGAGPLPELVDAIEAGDRVAVIMQPPPSADDPAPQRTANLTTFREGKVIEMVHYANAADALAALGPADSRH
jgi:ketosteroid isomerase-like protein